MTLPWRGAASALRDDQLSQLVAEYDVTADHVRALVEVEASGRFFTPEGELPRRFEPHHLPPETQAAIGWSGGWRASLGLDRLPGRRRALFEAAFALAPADAMAATSWGGPQIMGWHFADLGWPSVDAMVAAFAAAALDQVRAMLRLLVVMDRISALRACDWHAVALAWNGAGQAAVYAQRLESAWRRITGRASAQVLRLGATGASVRQLQGALGVPVDGRFGPGTLAAVRDAQAAAGLRVDGIVGDRTWSALRAASGPEAAPLPVPRAQRSLGDTAKDVAATASAASSAVSAAAIASGQAEGMLARLRDLVSPEYGDLLVLGILGAGVVIGGVLLVVQALRRPTA